MMCLACINENEEKEKKRECWLKVYSYNVNVLSRQLFVVRYIQLNIMAYFKTHFSATACAPWL